MRRMQEPILFKAYKPEEVTAELTLGDVVEEVTKINLGTKTVDTPEDIKNWNVYQLNFDSYDGETPLEGSSIIYLKEGYAYNFHMIVKYMDGEDIKGVRTDVNSMIFDISNDLDIYGFRVTLQLIATNQDLQTDYE